MKRARVISLAALLFLAGIAAPHAQADVGITLGYTLPVVQHAGPALAIEATQVQGALQAAFEIKPKFAAGVLLSVREHRLVPEEVSAGKTLEAVGVIPLNALVYWHPLEKMFDPYVVGQLGPVFMNEQYLRDGIDLSTRWYVGPMVGAGAGASLRLPVSPLLETRCELGFPFGDRVKTLALCGVTLGIVAGF